MLKEKSELTQVSIAEHVQAVFVSLSSSQTLSISPHSLKYQWPGGWWKPLLVKVWSNACECARPCLRSHTEPTVIPIDLSTLLSPHSPLTSWAPMEIKNKYFFHFIVRKVSALSKSVLTIPWGLLSLFYTEHNLFPEENRLSFKIRAVDCKNCHSILQLLPSKGGVYFLTPWIWLCDF